MQEGKPKLCSKSPFLSRHFVLKSAQPIARPQNARPGAARQSWLLGQNPERYDKFCGITWFYWDASLGDSTWQLKSTMKKSQKIPLWHSVTNITFAMNCNNDRIGLKWDEIGWNESEDMYTWTINDHKNPPWSFPYETRGVMDGYKLFFFFW